MVKKAGKQRDINVEKLPGGVTGKGFVAGDPRINRRGRPRSHKQLEELIQQIGWEDSESNSEWHRLELKIKAMYASKDPRDSQMLFDHGFGKVRAALDVDVTASVATVSPKALEATRKARWEAVKPALLAALSEDDDPGSE